jgi:hypothetical protein
MVPAKGRFIAVPADPDSGVVFGAEHLRDLGCRPAERLDLPDDQAQPIRDRLGILGSNGTDERYGSY